MNAESEMAGADGLGAEGLDPCAQIAESVGYHAEGEGSMEVLIAYKDALEGAVRRLTSAEPNDVRELVDGWTEGDLCPAAQDTADAIASKAVEEERERMLCEVAVEAAKDALRIPPGQYMTNARVRSAFNAALAALDQNGDSDAEPDDVRESRERTDEWGFRDGASDV